MRGCVEAQSYKPACRGQARSWKPTNQRRGGSSEPIALIPASEQPATQINAGDPRPCAGVCKLGGSIASIRPRNKSGDFYSSFCLTAGFESLASRASASSANCFRNLASRTSARWLRVPQPDGFEYLSKFRQLGQDSWYRQIKQCSEPA